MPSLLTRPTLPSMLCCPGVGTREGVAETDCFVRVAPVLKEAAAAGKINLTSIVNTHQYGRY